MLYMRRKTIIRLAALLLLAGVACTACSSGEHMYKHRRSNCDCPTF